MSDQTRDQIIAGTPLPESKIVYQFQWNGGLYLPHIWHDISNQELLAAVKADPAQYQLRAVVPVDVLLRAPAATVVSVRADLDPSILQRPENIGQAPKLEDFAYTVNLTEDSRAQRTTEGECNLTRYEPNFHDGEEGMEVCATGDYYAVSDVEALLAAPAAGQAGLATELREFASNPGYSHNDYADTMRAAAAELDRRAAPVAADTEQATARDIWTLLCEHGEYTRSGNYTVIYEHHIKGIHDRITHLFTPLATPADAGAGQQPDLLNEVADVLAAQNWRGDLQERLREAAAGSPAPVTAEPAVGIHWSASAGHWMLNVYADLPKIANKLHQFYAAPADRDAIRDQALEDAAKACEAWGDEKVKKWADEPEMSEDAKARGWDAYICAAQVRALKSMERAADAAETRDVKGGEHGN